VLPQVRHLQERLAVGVALLQRHVLGGEFLHLGRDLDLVDLEGLRVENAGEFHEAVFVELLDRLDRDGVPRRHAVGGHESRIAECGAGSNVPDFALRYYFVFARR
jgi:hypothetical protein